MTQSALDLVEGLQLARAVLTLHDLGILEALKRPATAEKLAPAFKLDPMMLRGVLEYVAARTNLVQRKGERFVATPGYGPQARYLLDLYGFAFGSNAAQLPELLRKPKLAPDAVDRVRHARAFAHAGPQTSAMPSILRQLELNHVLDLGCGPATMLADLAQHDPAFTGWGLERNPEMCKAARRNVPKKQVKIIEGDAMRIRQSLPREIASRVRGVVASQFMNELFGRGPALAIRWLRSLRSMLPNRVLLIADYYGRLGTGYDAPRELLLHDYAQLISGQGVPPPDLDGWNAIYEAAGCRLAHVLEDNHTTLFVHVVVLSAAGQARRAH